MEDLLLVLDAGHLRDVDRHVADLQHVARSHRVPGIHDTIVPEGDIEAGIHQFAHAGHAAALRIGVVPALQHDVNQGVGDHVDPRLRHQRDQLGDVVVVHRVHRGQMRAGDASLQAKADGFRGQRLDMARERIVGFVAMHVDRQAAIGGDAAERLDRSRTFAHRPFEVGNAADDIDSHVEGTVERVDRARRAVITVLGKGDQLQIDIGRDLFANLDHRLHGHQSGIASIDMTADKEQALRHRQIAIAQRTIDQFLLRHDRAQLSPERDALEQGAGYVHARQSERQGGVHVEMRIDERRTDQPAGCVDFFPRLRLEIALDSDDPAALDADIDAASRPSAKICISDDQIEHRSLIGCERFQRSPRR